MNAHKESHLFELTYVVIVILALLFANAFLGTVLYHYLLRYEISFYVAQIAMLVLTLIGIVGFVVYTAAFAEESICDFFLGFLTSLGFELAPFALIAVVVGIVAVLCMAVVLFFGWIMINLLFGGA